MQFAKLARDLRENPPEGLFMSTGGGGGGGSTNAAGGNQEESEDEYADGLCWSELRGDLLIQHSYF